MAEKEKPTVINKIFTKRDTVINSEVQSSDPNFTVINPTVRYNSIEIPEGTVLSDKYMVGAPLSKNSGEANLYLCTYQDTTYVAKVYRRQTALKKDIAVALESIKSPYVATLYATGSWNGNPYEILPYYKYGSLEGKQFSFERLRKDIIPALNEGIHALHKKKIIHKDLKPSNIMLCDNQKSVAIIDFGISSIREGGNTVVVTKTGMTPEYSAPETFRNLFLEESDYYSLGVTLYELYCGHTPYSGTDKALIEQYIAIQKIPFPDKFPNELRRLITGLTYTDITNRKSKDNPNRRWTYEEVKRWCAGEMLPLPGGEEDVQTAAYAASTSSAIPAYTFMYKKYTRLGELVEAMANDWDNGKKRLYRSMLSEYFRKFNQEYASYCMDAEDAVRQDKTKAKQDYEYFCVLYKLYPQLESFHWKSYHYSSMRMLGEVFLSAVRYTNTDLLAMCDEMITNHLFAARERIVNPRDSRTAVTMKAIEDKYILAKQQNNHRVQFEQIYIIGYTYSKSHELIVSSKSFNSIDELADYTKSLMKQSDKALDSFSSELLYTVSESGNGRMNQSVAATPQFSAWLTVMGKGDVL